MVCLRSHGASGRGDLVAEILRGLEGLQAMPQEKTKEAGIRIWEPWSMGRFCFF